MTKRVVVSVFLLVILLFTIKLACVASTVQEVRVPVNVKLNSDKYQILKEEVLDEKLIDLTKKDTVTVKRVLYRRKR